MRHLGRPYLRPHWPWPALEPGRCLALREAGVRWRRGGAEGERFLSGGIVLGERPGSGYWNDHRLFDQLIEVIAVAVGSYAMVIAVLIVVTALDRSTDQALVAQPPAAGVVATTQATSGTEDSSPSVVRSPSAVAPAPNVTPASPPLVVYAPAPSPSLVTPTPSEIPPEPLVVAPSAPSPPVVTPTPEVTQTPREDAGAGGGPSAIGLSHGLQRTDPPIAAANRDRAHGLRRALGRTESP